jgi:hypothetical protein
MNVRGREVIYFVLFIMSLLGMLLIIKLVFLQDFNDPYFGKSPVRVVHEPSDNLETEWRQKWMPNGKESKDSIFRQGEQ